MELAVIKTGGKQYLVSPGKKIKIEKIEGPASEKSTAGKEEGKEVTFNEVLLWEKDPSTSSGQAQVEIGTPFLKEVKVVGKILKQGRGKKVIVFKVKKKKRYKVKKGHRQLYTEIEILKISN